MSKYLNLNNNVSIAYEQLSGKSPGVMFCGGYRSDMSGAKAIYVEEICRELGQSYLRFDYQGHGQSSGEFTDGTIGQWFNDALTVFDKLTQGPQILIGSSMGGWIALLIALARPARVKAYIGIAAAPDFTEDLMWNTFPTDLQNELLSENKIEVKSEYSNDPYLITRQLIEEGRQHLLLRQLIPLTIPIRLIHGMLDEDVPWQRSITLAEQLKSSDVQITLIKDGDHRLSREQDLLILRDKLLELIIKF